MLCARTTRGPINPRSLQTGAAFIVMLVIMVLGITTILVTSLSGYALRIGREQITAVALAKAKEALIGYAVNSENDSSETEFRPGNLPCPDTDAPDTAGYGYEQSTCSAGTIGRLPWKTLGINELTDESGETLWYSISGNFRKRSIVSSSIINSDTSGTLDVYDNDGTTLLTTTGSKAVAVIFAPGHIIGSQQRGSATEKTTASNYLDTGGTGTSRNNATTNGPFVAASETTTFNDRLIYITPDQLMPNVEKRVAGIAKELLSAYYTGWGDYPFASTFSSPSSSQFIGSTGTYQGLLPVGGLNGIGDYSYPTWNSIPSITFSGGSGSSSDGCELRSGSDLDGNSVSNGRWRCNNVTLPAGRTVTITGTLNKIGRGFWKLHEVSDNTQVRVRDSSGNTISSSNLQNYLNPISITGTLNTDGSATITFKATAVAAFNFDRIELRDIRTYQSVVPTWFGINKWEQVMYYSVSPGYSPGAANACTPLPGTPSCLTLNGTGSSADKHALIIMTGRAISGSHPSGTLGNYLEGENATPADYIYENQARSSAFNDQVLAIAP